VSPRALEAAHRRYLLVEQGIGAAIFNLLLNAGIAWLMVRSLEKVPTWGSDMSIVGDTIGTAFLLPFFTCLIVTRLARGQVRSGRLPPLPWHRTSHAALRRLPARTLPRAALLGLVCVIAFAPVVVWALAALEVNELGVWRFVAFKALFAAALAAVVSPVIALGALGDAVAE
jgi:Mg/Co/Ni transporter MgtE